MARKKPDGTWTAGKARKPQGVALIVRYIPVAIAMMTERIIANDEAGAKQLYAEIIEQLAIAFRGVALAAMTALIDREWKLAQNFASPHVIDVAFDEGDVAMASRFHEPEPDTSTIDHE